MHFVIWLRLVALLLLLHSTHTVVYFLFFFLHSFLHYFFCRLIIVDNESGVQALELVDQDCLQSKSNCSIHGFFFFIIKMCIYFLFCFSSFLSLSLILILSSCVLRALWNLPIISFLLTFFLHQIIIIIIYRNNKMRRKINYNLWFFFYVEQEKM